MDKKLFEIIACPLCKGDLNYRKDEAELVCRPCGLAYPIRDDIPVMLDNEARTLTTDERLDGGEAPAASKDSAAKESASDDAAGEGSA
ncbi:hypothetical protein EOPP23_19915 [Endozoicomonas sp. OPT23]|nr:hypothetical protein [Endozoicomonas sp. OPT23]